MRQDVQLRCHAFYSVYIVKTSDLQCTYGFPFSKRLVWPTSVRSPGWPRSDLCLVVGARGHIFFLANHFFWELTSHGTNFENQLITIPLGGECHFKNIHENYPWNPAHALPLDFLHIPLDCSFCYTLFLFYTFPTFFSFASLSSPLPFYHHVGFPCHLIFFTSDSDEEAKGAWSQGHKAWCLGIPLL